MSPNVPCCKRRFASPNKGFAKQDHGWQTVGEGGVGMGCIGITQANGSQAPEGGVLSAKRAGFTRI